MINRKILAVVGGLTSLVISQPAAADTHCFGVITSTHVARDGAVFVNAAWRGDFLQVCSLQTEWKGVTPDVCAAWTAKIDSAVAFGKIATFYYSETMTCSAVPAYGNAPAPWYVMLHSS